MKKLLLSASSALLLAGIASQAQAYDGVISFNGSVSAQTCTISAAGGTNTGTVTLPSVSTSALAAANTTAGTTEFAIKLSGCSGNTAQAAAWFESGGNVNAAGRLTNTGLATNVDVALYNVGSVTPIAIGQGSGAIGSSGAAFPISNGTATMNYQAKYFATGAATAGSVVATVNYTIQYQ